MTGERMDWKRNPCLQLGAYCQVREEDQPQNSQLPWTKGAIVLGPSGNIQGGYKFMSLVTGSKKITRHSWDQIPIPDTVIQQVNILAHDDQPDQLVFTDQRDWRIGDVEITGVDGHEAMEDSPYTPRDILIEDFEQYEQYERMEVDPDITPQKI
jgi:hypothetical protein